MFHNFKLRSLIVSFDGEGFLYAKPASREKKNWVSSHTKFHCFSILLNVHVQGAYPTSYLLSIFKLFARWLGI